MLSSWAHITIRHKKKEVNDHAHIPALKLNDLLLYVPNRPHFEYGVHLPIFVILIEVSR